MYGRGQRPVTFRVNRRVVVERDAEIPVADKFFVRFFLRLQWFVFDVRVENVVRLLVERQLLEQTIFHEQFVWIGKKTKYAVLF